MTGGTDFDAIVIGSGSGGRAVARYLAGDGLTVAMVEAELIGGECPYWACMPAKALLRPPEAVAAARRVPGVSAAIADLDAVLGFREEVVSGRDDAEKVERYTALGVTIVRGRARIAGPGRVDVAGRTLTAPRLVLATGSSPVIPDIDGLDDVEYWTNREAMALRRIPESAALLGGGPVGVEIGQMLARLGSRVTIIDESPRLLAGEEPEVGEFLAQRFRDEGIEVLLHAEVTAVRPEGAGARIVLGGGSRLVERLVVCTGRRPRVEDIGLESVGIVPGESGIEVDDRCRAGEGVWAVGDVTGVGQFTHLAAYQARVVRADINGEVVRADYSAVPRSVFCDPEVAAVGLTASAARDEGISVATATVPLGDLERATTYGRGIDGIIGVVADRDAGVLVGAHGVGPLASEWMGIAVLAIRARVPVAELREVILQFPTFSEGLLTAARRLEM